MQVQIRDRTALSSLSVVSLRSYLISREWKNQGSWGERPATIFAKEHGGRWWEVRLPTRDTVADYAENMAESVSVLAQIEGRSQLEVFYDLAASGADVIRVRAADGTVGGPLSLRRSASLLNDAYNMLAASARAAERPKAAYRGKMSSDVADYLDNVHPVPSDYRDYSMTLHSPVPMGFGRQGDFGDGFLAPFSRMVTTKLAQGLEHTTTAVERAVADDTLEPFRQAVDHGVSANLCDSVAALARQSQGIEIDLIWADVRPSEASDSHFQFSPASADILVEAARSFRRDEPWLDESVVAQVVKLERDLREFDGRATILYVWDGHPTRIQVTFEESFYNTVIEAFQKREPIKVDGDIYRAGSGYQLRNPRNLALLTEPER